MPRRLRINVRRHSTSVSTHYSFTGRDLARLAEQREATRVRLVGEHAAQTYRAWQGMNEAALRLHTPHVAAPLLAVYAVSVVATLATGAPLFLAGGLLAFVDGWQLATLHGAINWPLWWERLKGGGWWLALAALICWPLVAVLPAAYFVQCLTRAGDARELRRMRLVEEIDRLEAETRPRPQLRQVEPPPSAP